ncbi:MAG TPA: hypothetical protein VEF04_21890, partial [Blastocatellia bacterium]|nr:hypothetical protein [Blastocatellia bacterium]
MKPLKLYTRITILISLILTAVLLAVVFFFISKTRDIEVQEQENRARRLVQQLANQLSSASLSLAELRRYAVVFKEAHIDQIDEIRLYGESPNGLSEIISLTPAETEKINERDLQRLRNNETIVALRNVETEDGSQIVIYAAAPLF